MSENISDNIKNAIPPLYAVLEQLDAKRNEIKKTINSLSLLAGENPPFSDLEVSNYSGVSNISPDQFFGKPFASAVKSFLKLKGKATTAEEILDALTKGGFEFPDEWDQKYYLKTIASSLGKNTNDFVSINNGSFKAFGIWDFYPEKKKKKEKNQKEKLSKEEPETNQEDADVASVEDLASQN